MKKNTESHNRPAKHSRTKAKQYLYAVRWSEDDEAYVARVAEFPSLGAHGDSEREALRSLQQVVKAVVKDLVASNEPIPRPLVYKTE